MRFIKRERHNPLPSRPSCLPLLLSRLLILFMPHLILRRVEVNEGMRPVLDPSTDVLGVPRIGGKLRAPYVGNTLP